jgi:NADP-dependent 3-hydroxy acid dehydrogenase YdfG
MIFPSLARRLFEYSKASRGHAVVLGARREAALAALASELNDAGGRAEYLVTDVTGFSR